MLQYSTTHRTNNMADVVTQAGTTAHLAIFTGAPPANAGTAPSGTLLVSLPMSNPIGTVSAGVLTASAITATAAVAAGNAGYFKIFPTATVTGTDSVAQGNCYAGSTLVTSAATAAGNILTFTATSPIVAGQTVSGTNIPAGTYALDVTGTTVTLSNNVTSTGVASGATITFGGDVTFTGTVAIALGQNVTASSLVLTATGA